ncbi:MAG: protein kinase domain-containing protein [Gemmatimonadaceae bacterium]
MSAARPSTSSSTAASIRWGALEPLLHAALELDPARRGAYLDDVCVNAAQRRELDALIAAHERSGRLDALADSIMTPLLTPLRTPQNTPARTPRPARSQAPVVVPQLERYRVIERLGGGGMGIVYRARDERLDRDVALKFLPPHLSSDEAAKKRFMVEARAAASLEHPNICTVHEIGETADGQLYIVMGCYDGETLDKRIDRGPLALGDALHIAAEVTRGLVKAHERGIVHRDIKPANIMLTADGVVKILDFGIAKLADLTATQSGGAIGTLAYMSPEQAFGDTVDHRTDIWALGVVLHEMLIGGRPFRGPGEQAVLFAMLTQHPELVAARRADVPPSVDILLQRALSKKVADRFATAQEMLGGILAIAESSSGSNGSTESVTARFGPNAAIVPREPADTALARAGERRYATVVVTGIANYSSHIEWLPPEELDRVLGAVRNAANEVATRHGGIVNQFSHGEAVLLFGVPVSHEDDYLRAVRAALELHARVHALGASELASSAPELALRSGVHTGSVVAQRLRSGDQRFRVTGTPIDVATRLASFAETDAVLISPECQRLVAPFVDAEPAPTVMLQADGAPVSPYRITGDSGIHARHEVFDRADLTPFAGRTRELRMLEDQVESAIRGEGSVTVILGEAGSGKSRLLRELRRLVDDGSTRLVLGRCDAYGGTTPYLPFVQAIRSLLDLGGDGASSVAELVARVRAIDESLSEFLPLYCALLAMPSATYPLPRHMQGEHLQAAMLEALAALITLHARQRPTVLLLEDWHWADEASRIALGQLGDIAPAYPLLVLVSCRPEGGIDWTAGEHRTLLHLAPLGAEASLRIVREVAGADTVDPELARLLHERTGGNPFFLEETCQALLESGVLEVHDGHAVALDDTRTLRFPETVQAVIRTRMDRLEPDARDVLRVASVIGREFSRGVLESITEPTIDIARQLERLRGSGLIHQISVAPEPVYRFKHVLTQEVAYDTLLEHQRQALHAAAGRAIEQRYPDRLDEQLERLAHHFGRGETWDAAVKYGVRAADRSQALSQFADALAMLDQTLAWALDLAGESERRDARADVLLRQERLCETLGLRARQLEIVDELIALLAPRGGSPRLAEAYLRQGDVFTLLRHFDAADRALGTSLRLSRELGNRAAERNALRSIGLLRSHEGRTAEAIDWIEQALALDVELGETTAAAGDVASLGNILRKTGRHEDALDALQQALEYLTAHDDPVKSCMVLSTMAAVYRDLGGDDEALRYLERARDQAIERRLPILASFSLPGIAQIQLQRGRIEEALGTYRQAVGLSRRARHAEGLAQSLRALGEVLFGLDRHAEALPHLREAAQLYAQLEDRAMQAAIWRRIATASERCNAPDEAEPVWEAIRQRSASLGDPAGEALALEGIARCVRQRGVRGLAIERYEEALARATHAGDVARQVALRNTLGILRWEDGAFTEALAQYEEALRLCRDLHDRIHEGLILNSLGATLLRLQRFDEARTAVEESIRINRETGQRQLEAHAEAVLGNVLLSIGWSRDATRAFERSLAMRIELGDRRGEGWMQEHLARAQRAEHRDPEARAAREAGRVIARELGDAALAAALELEAVDPSTPNAGGG